MRSIVHRAQSTEKHSTFPHQQAMVRHLYFLKDSQLVAADRNGTEIGQLRFP